MSRTVGGGHHTTHGAGHTHVHTDSRARLWATLLLIVGFMCVEVVGGILAGSMALLADAGHMLIDASAIGLSLLAMHYARRPASGDWTFGLRRLEIMAAQINGLTLFALAGVVAYESFRRLSAPPEVAGGWVVVVATVGALVNVIALVILSGADRQNLNVEGSYQHVLMDLLGSIAAIVAGAVVAMTGNNRADPIAALVVAGLMTRSAWRLVRSSSRVLMQAAPSGLHADDVGNAMARVPGVAQVHDLHLWEVTSGFPTLSAHLVVHRDFDCHDVRRAVQRQLLHQYGIEHATLQTDHAPRRFHGIGGRPPGNRV